MLRVAKTTVGVAVLGSLLFSGASAFGAAAPAGGTIKVWLTPANNGGGGGGSVVITGAVGDYGKTVRVNSAGKIDKKGTFGVLVLKKGTILVDRTQLVAATQNSQPTDLNAVTCSASQTASAPVPIVSGTKAYAGISGTVNITQTFAFVLPLTNGKCDTNTNANPIAQYGSVAGTGTVSFG
jgi:hypothetical protein